MAINIRTAIDECARHTADIRRRNNTLIDYYIYPEPVPTGIAAYEPGIATLQDRITSIKKLNFSQLQQLIDDPDCIAAIHLKMIINELINATLGYKCLFEAHYDPSLSQRAPYAATIESLELLRHRLHDLIETRTNNRNRPRAEHHLAHHNSSGNSTYHFCQGAIQVLNNNDNGRIANVSDTELLPSNHEVLAEKSGAYLWWKCPLDSCTFKLRFHIISSQASSIHNNSEIRTHSSVPLQYRSTLLIKSHLHVSSDNCGTAKYGCLLCFAEGFPLGEGVTAFSTGKELAMHLFGAHKEPKLPAAMVLEMFRIAVGGQCPFNVQRWDVNFPRG